MPNGGSIAILDGTHLRALRVSIPDAVSTLTGAQVLDLADSEASNSLFGLTLPQNVNSSALNRLNHLPGGDEVAFRRTELSREAAASVLHDYITALADELKENPLVVSVLDGNTLRLFLEDEDDFAMLAENLFTDLDVEDKGKISKGEIRNALLHMGVEMGVPPFQEYPLLNDILKKHGAEGEEELGQSQFAELLQPILQDVADALAEKHVAVMHNIKIVNGSKLRKLLANEEQLNKVIDEILQDNHGIKDDQKSMEIIRSFLERSGKELGLPPSEANEAVVLLYDAIFADVESEKSAGEGKDAIRELVKEILEKFADQLEANPVYCDLDSRM